MHALIFSQRLSDKDGTPLPFGKASALAVVYLGICTAFYIVAGVAIQLVLSWLLEVTRWA